MNASLSRRSFVGAAGCAIAAAGASSALATEAPEAAAGLPIASTVDVDVVVAGAGAAGTVAATVIAEGGKSVLLLEKLPQIGGAGAISGGMLGCNTVLQQQAGYDVQVEPLFEAWNEYNHSLCYAPLVKKIFSTSADTIQWMLDHEAPFEASPGSLQGGHVDDPLKWQCYHRHIDRNGRAVFDKLQAALEANGAAIEYGAVFQDLVQDADGMVTGLVYQNANGEYVQVNAAKTILATGGFDGNDEMMVEVFGTDAIGGLKLMGIDDQGEGIRAAWKAGARRWNTQSALFHGGSPATPHFGVVNAVVSGLLQVDATGTRYTDETVVGSTCLWANANLATGGNVFVLLDNRVVEDFVNNAFPLAPLNTDTIPPAEDTSGMRDDLEASVEYGAVFIADTLDELAAATGMDPQVLAATVARYNGLVEAGVDEDFGKDPAYLAYKVEEGPFYAIKCGVGSLGTSGGLFVNTRMQPLTRAMQPIPNLYTVGSMAAGAYYGSLPGYPDYEGAALCFAYTSGLIAGRDVLENL